MRFRLIVLGPLLALAIAAIVLVNPLHLAPATSPSADATASPGPALADAPPAVTASYTGQEQRGTLGSYCWNGCADTFLLIPTQPITVPPAAKVRFEITEPIAPHRLLVTLFLVDASEHVPSPDPNSLALGAGSEFARALPARATRFEFEMPDRAGDYALNLFGEWQTGSDSGPDASYGFHIVVGGSPDRTPLAAHATVTATVVASAGPATPPATTAATLVAAVAPSPTAVPALERPAVDAAIARLSKYGMEDPRAVSVIQVTPMTWPDDCLGLPSGLPCHSNPTSGYAVELEKAGQRYVVRTDSEGKLVRLALAPSETITDAFLQWELNDGKECRTLRMSTERLQYGFCGEALLAESSQATMWPDLGGESQASYWQRTYAPFTTTTVRGTVVFTGTGTTVATEAEERAISEWARERWEEHWWGYLNAVYDLDLGWSEKNGSFCGGLWIYRTGLAVAWNWEGSAALGTRFLQGAQLKQFYAWLDGKNRWLINPNEQVPGVPPGTSLGFLWGNPTQNATDQDTQDMLRFLHTVYSSLTSTGSATGKVILGYGAHGTVAGLPLSIDDEPHGGPNAFTDANGEFTLKHLPLGLDGVSGNHLRFQVQVTSADSEINLGVLKYPLVHLPDSYYQSPAPLSSLSDLQSQGQPITFTVCQTDPAWTRPAETLQRDQVWSKRPFSDKGDQCLQQWFRQPAVIYDSIDVFQQSFPDGPNLDALAADLRYLTGLWTGQDLSRSRCLYDGDALEGLLGRQEIEVWLMGYRALEVRRMEMPYSIVYNKPITQGHPDFLKVDRPSEHIAITVQAAPGFQIIRFPGHSDPLAVHLIEDGKELTASPYESVLSFGK